MTLRTVRVKTRGGPEMKEYWTEVPVLPILKKRKTPDLPPNFLPQDKARTCDSDHPPVLTFVQGVSQALEKKED